MTTEALNRSPAVDDPMPDGVDLAAVLHHPDVGAGQERQHALHGDLVLEDLLGLAQRAPVRGLVLEDARRPPMFSTWPLGERAVGARGGAGAVGAARAGSAPTSCRS